MNIRFCMFLLFLLIVFCSSYTLTGQWKLTQLNGKSTDKAIILNIFQSVISPKQIRNILQFSNCHNILYQVKVNDNLMIFDEKKVDQTFLDTNTNILFEQNTKECSQDESNLEKRIADTLKKVFFFNIRDDLLVFISTNGMDLFEFERVKKVYENSLLGTWVLDRLFWEKALPTKVLITQDNKAYFCDGKIQATYTTNKVNFISFEITKNENCPQINLTKAINHIKYFRLKDTELELFDEFSVQIAEIWYQGKEINLQPKQTVVNSSEQLQKLKKQGSVIIIDPINTVQVENQLQPYLRKEDEKVEIKLLIQNRIEN